jgi:ribonuclease HI
MGRAEDIIQQVCSLEDIEPGEEWVRVPAEFCTSFSVRITLDRACRRQNPAVVEAEVQGLIFENSSDGDVVIYTDGSVVRHMRSSWAFTAQVSGRVVEEDSGAFALTTSSLTMEVMAVSKAIAWLETQTFSHACFLSDSMSMLRKIEMGWARKQWLVSLRRSGLSRISFIFVPGHAGVKGNERADRLAGSATVGNGRAMDQADILHALREAGRVKDSSHDCDSATLTRFQEIHVRRGEARRECYAGSHRRLVNQHRTGVVSRYTLRDILKMRSEHLWTLFDVQ